ncbi:AraC family transcriptional regulator ligand-binding domain-containing protein [Microbulbifer sp. 2201CG32-9]|uniref:AraC family transcriptional regulator ligand-binding domain-containing protein n=1 Tax=Microbulbifer sp. 2201CG32-9 TaxID=3232309 RepID=UPI00345C1700
MLLKTNSFSGFYTLVASLGKDPDALLRRCDIDPGKAANTARELPLNTRIHLIETAAQEFDCADFGLRLAELQDTRTLAEIASLILAQATVREGLETIIGYLGQSFPGILMEVQTSHRGGLARMVLKLGQGEVCQRQSVELALRTIHKLLQLIGAGSFPLTKVQMRAPVPLQHRRYQSVFGAPVEFSGDIDALLFRSELLSKPIPQDHAELNRLAAEYRDRDALHQPLGLIRRVKQLIYELLPSHQCTLAAVARHLGLHKRTLQRKLAKESLVFEEIIDRTRRKQAEIYLAQPGASMTHIASMLGYREQSSLNRSCRRWFNCTPMERRRQLLTEAEPAGA